MSRTTAIFSASVSRWSRSGARIVCQVFRFPSIGYGVTVLLVGGRAPEKDWDVFFRSTDRSGALSFRELHAAGPGLVLQADLNLAVWTSQPWHDKLLTWGVAQAARLVVAGSSRCSSNGSGGPGFGPHRRRSSRYEESDWYSTSNRVFTASRIAGTSQNPARTPDRESGRARVLPSGRGRVPPRPGSPHARPGPGASWCPATRPAIPAPSSQCAQPSSR